MSKHKVTITESPGKVMVVEKVKKPEGCAACARGEKARFVGYCECGGILTPTGEEITTGIGILVYGCDRCKHCTHISRDRLPGYEHPWHLGGQP